MKYHVYEVIDNSGEHLFVFIREDEFFRCMNVRELQRPEFVFNALKFVSINSQHPARCWTHVFLEKDEEVNVVATEVEEQDVLPVIKLHLMLE